MNKCFIGTTLTAISSETPNLQPHTGMLPVAKGVNINFNVLNILCLLSVCRGLQKFLYWCVRFRVSDIAKLMDENALENNNRDSVAHELLRGDSKQNVLDLIVSKRVVVYPYS